MDYFTSLIQMILSLAQTPEEAERLVKQVVDVNWQELFALKARCEHEIGQLHQKYRETHSTDGVCQFCQAHVAKAAMPAHIRTCLQQQETVRARAKSRMHPKFLIGVSGNERPEYWGYIEVERESRLSAIDAILRNAWLECCDHISSFSIAGQRYESHNDPDEDWNPSEANSMRVALNRILKSGTTFSYEYDIDSTTRLTLSVIDKYERKSFRGKTSPFLARNLAPNIECSVCGRQATRVCPRCREGVSLLGRGWYCQNCTGQHECGVEVLLPVSNSPRVGICGYTGKAYQAKREVDFQE